MRVLLLLLSVLLGLSATARAEDGVGVVVIGDATFQPQFATQLESWLQQHGHKVVPSALSPEAITRMIDCFVIEDEECARGVFEKVGRSQSLVFARLDVAPEAEAERTITVTAYWYDKGRDAIAERRHCERCTSVILEHTADDLMSALTRAGQRGTGMLVVTSTPAGARVLINGNAVGITPLEYELASGEHTLTLSHDQYAVETRAVAIRTGETTRVTVPLSHADDGGAGRARTLPLALMVGGGVALAAGMVLYAVDEDDDGSQFEYRDTAPLGVGLGVAGVAALGVGAYLYFRGSETEPRSAPTLSLGRAGAVVGWARSF